MPTPSPSRPAPLSGDGLAFLETPLNTLEWLPPLRARALERFGLLTVEDLLTHFPRRYEDRREFDRFPSDEMDHPVCLCGNVLKTASRRFQGYRFMFEATLQEVTADGQPTALSGQLTCRWYNVHFVKKMIAAGQRLVVYGRPRRRGRQLLIEHPEFEVVEPDAEASIHLRRITPVHPATEGITARMLRSWIHRLLANLPDLPSPLPEGLAGLPYAEALRAVHFPENWEALHAARRDLVLAEFFHMQLFVAAKRAELRLRPGHPHCGPGGLLEAFHAELPFPLTGAQHRAIGEIRADLAAPRPMNRLLHGDVGSGKTVVALSAMLLAVEAGYQAALMAPTQILAEQHYLNFKRWLAPLGVRIALRTGSRKEETALPLFDEQAWNAAVREGDEARRSELIKQIASDEPQILVGTHALLSEGVPMSRLGLAVIDEQHKFGVLQRAALSRGSAEADVLVMTATPIPRTLTMTLFGDLDVSTLDEAPANRGKIVTAARDASKLPDAIAFMKEHLGRGRQAYVVYPLIDASAKMEAKAAAAEFEKWERALAPHRCELLHGRIPPDEKEAIMGRFRRNETQVLVATTVIEVGIDVPNANLMLIENAERFGLAQLHQLRGRIGRGTHKSYCVLIHAADTPEGVEKMKTMEATANGFEIAEADLRLRGPGDILGTDQSGLPPLKIGDVLADTELMQLARTTALRLFAADPQLARPEHARFRKRLAEKRKLALAQVS
ncbi:MAG: ATP-dependent DNA helicase RecG [Chthoniobacteraceae bacterium]|nr:ATP-dependent DNA helicase RecG [Chthoniobacteraceae bacterium]